VVLPELRHDAEHLRIMTPMGRLPAARLALG
jgi:hypothetical protein